MTKAENFTYFILRWISAWASLLDGFIAVFSFGTVWTNISFKATAFQIRYSLDCMEDENIY